jgi:undecaprenyl diphosphate synthase
MIDKLLFWRKKKEINVNLLEAVEKNPVPKHIAIIMDGNGRWAKKRAMPRIAGHHEGTKVVQRITRIADKLGVEVLTLYAFSTENWKRPKGEVDYLMKLPEQMFSTFLPELIEKNVRVQMIGNFDKLPSHTQRTIQKAMDETKHNTGLILNFALNYGSRDEMIQAVQQIAKECKENHLDVHDINEETIAAHLMTNKIADPELLIRTSGEIRISNFMLWQIAYSEFWFTDVLWPDFTEEHLIQAIYDFQHRGRRFGGV